MNTILVWVLITVGGPRANEVVYSPPMPDLPTCQFLQKTMSDSHIRGRCVQIRMVDTK